MSYLTQTINNQGDACHRSPLWSRSAHIGVSTLLIDLRSLAMKALLAANRLASSNGPKMRISFHVNTFGTEDSVP